MAQAPTNGFLERLGSEASLDNLVLVVVWTRLSGLETEAVQQVDVGLSALGFVVGVPDSLDLLQAKVLADLVLGGEDGLHGCGEDGYE